MSILGLVLLLYTGVLFLCGNVALKQNRIRLVPRKKMPRVAILIAARDESKVIEGLLKSIQ